MGAKARYANIYAALAGRKPHKRLWHHQWLSTYALERDLRRLLPKMKGRVLDVGCGTKPYGRWLTNASEHVGIDIFSGPTVDRVFDGMTIPFADASMDAVLCTQVLEHAVDASHLCDEIVRVLKPTGLLVASLPFLGNEHDAPHDYRRYTVYGLAGCWPDALTVDEVRREGGIGSTLGIMLLNWWEIASTQSRILFLIKVVTLPIFLLVSLLVNILGAALDTLDRTGCFYGDVLLVGHKAPGDGHP